MKTVTILGLFAMVLTLSGCGLSKSLIRDVVAIAPAICSETTQETVEAAYAQIMADVPNGTDKEKAQRMFADAREYPELACNTLKILEEVMVAKQEANTATQ